AARCRWSSSSPSSETGPRGRSTWSSSPSSPASRAGHAGAERVLVPGPPGEWSQSPDLLAVGEVLRAVLAHQVALLELDADPDVPEHSERKDEVTHGHRRRGPEGEDEPQVERMAHELVEHRRPEPCGPRLGPAGDQIDL